MSLSTSKAGDKSLWDLLKVGGIYVLLFIRDPSPKANDFHWGIYAHTEQEGGPQIPHQAFG